MKYVAHSFFHFTNEKNRDSKRLRNLLKVKNVNSDKSWNFNLKLFEYKTYNPQCFCLMFPPKWNNTKVLPWCMECKNETLSLEYFYSDFHRRGKEHPKPQLLGTRVWREHCFIAHFLHRSIISALNSENTVGFLEVKPMIWTAPGVPQSHVSPHSASSSLSR